MEDEGDLWSLLLFLQQGNSGSSGSSLEIQSIPLVAVVRLCSQVPVFASLNFDSR